MRPWSTVRVGVIVRVSLNATAGTVAAMVYGVRVGVIASCMAGVKSEAEAKSPLKLAEAVTATMLSLRVGMALGWGPRLHALAPDPDALPLSQAAHLAAPGAAAYVLGAHGSHTPANVAPTVAEYEPAAQSSHEVLPAAPCKVRRQYFQSSEREASCLGP